MTDDRDKIKMHIDIAEEHITLHVPFSTQNRVRDTERDIRDLYSIWRKKYPAKTNGELLAMIAYQYASYYHDLLDRHIRALALVGECTAQAQSILSGPAATSPSHDMESSFTFS